MKLLIESGIRIPKGTRAAKIIFHADLDGVFSAILTMNQLIKQGISKDKIVLSSIQYGDNNYEVKQKLKASKGQMIALVDFARISDDPKEGIRKPDFWSDHHVQDKKQIDKKQIEQKQSANKKSDATIKSNIGDTPLRKVIKRNLKMKGITEAIGKTQYPSEAEHLAMVHAQNLMTGRDIEAVSKIDSANYTNLADVLDLPKDFRSKGRMERLAIIVNSLIGPIIKNETAVDKLIRDSSPSLASVYNNVLKISKLAENQITAIKEISKESPDWNKINQIRKGLPTEMAKTTVKGARVPMAPSSVEAAREKGKEDVEKSTDIKTTKFKRGSDLIIVQSAAGRGQPSRFMSSLLTKQTGERYPAAMREWSTMLQISLNPSLDISDKEKINLSEILDKVIDTIIADTNSGKIKVGDKGMTRWALTKVIKPESGGHAGIATASGLGTLGLMPKPNREELKKLEAFDRRVKALGGEKKMQNVMPQKAERMKELLLIKKEWIKDREMIIGEIKKRLIDATTEALKGAKPIPGEERFKAKPKSRIKEDIQYIVKHWK